MGLETRVMRRELASEENSITHPRIKQHASRPTPGVKLLNPLRIINKVINFLCHS